MGIFSKLKRKKSLIQCCSTNLDLFYNDEDLDAFENYAEEQGIELREMECLDNCDECPISSYAVYNKQKIFADNPDQVLAKIKKVRANE
ncbi:DUF1450 domain-containing protein [Aquibacillus sediminis]|uniref:DUF1450 domain-containing protein n=1 Tax=Aquibacillus sediminis TaxID=2574734 RepID=UPI001109FC3F|nr:DUF1450 domain-containing protein [Aquibacillus sediminis]